MARKGRRGNAAAIAKMLRMLPDQARHEMIVELNVTGREIAREMQGRAPRRTGALRAGIGFKVFPKTLKLQVGMVGTKRGRSKLFYARIQDLGRKAQTVTVRRFRAGGQRIYFRGKKFGPSVQTYNLRVRGMTGKRFVTGRFTDLRRALTRNLKSIWTRSLKKFTGTIDS